MAFWVGGAAAGPRPDGDLDGLAKTAFPLPSQKPLFRTAGVHEQQENQHQHQHHPVGLDFRQPQPVSFRGVHHHHQQQQHQQHTQYHRTAVQQHAHRIRYQSLQERVHNSQSPSPEPFFAHPFFNRPRSGPPTPTGPVSASPSFLIIRENASFEYPALDHDSSAPSEFSYPSSRPQSPLPCTAQQDIAPAFSMASHMVPLSNDVPTAKAPSKFSVNQFPHSHSVQQEIATTPHMAPLPNYMPSSAPMERTISGHSIRSEPGPESSERPSVQRQDYTDVAAATLVAEHTARHRPSSRPGRILRSLIQPKSRAADFRLDDIALESIFSCANEIFFAGRLSRRVRWDWSHPGAGQYERHVTGETAVRRSRQQDGYETLIVLSSPILKDTRYNRRLLISTFLHELIHSYLFVMCGFKAARCGGHNEGFIHIARVIDDWVGQEYLNLSDLKARLERYEEPEIITPVGDRNEVVIMPTESEKRGHSSQWRWNEPHAAPGGVHHHKHGD